MAYCSHSFTCMPVYLLPQTEQLVDLASLNWLDHLVVYHYRDLICDQSVVYHGSEYEKAHDFVHFLCYIDDNQS